MILCDEQIDDDDERSESIWSEYGKKLGAAGASDSQEAIRKPIGKRRRRRNNKTRRSRKKKKRREKQQEVSISFNSRRQQFKNSIVELGSNFHWGQQQEEAVATRSKSSIIMILLACGRMLL